MPAQTRIIHFYVCLGAAGGKECVVIMSLSSVKNYFKQYNMDTHIVEFPVSSATVELAAQAIGCKEQEIAKTMSFHVGEEVIVIVMAGDARIDNKKYKSFFHKKAKMLHGDEVESLTGHPVGGVCPFGLKDGIKVYLDESLERFDYVYPACGSPNSAIKLTIPELEKYAHQESWIDVTDII